MKVVEQYPINFFFECGAVSFDFVEQYLLISWSSIPNQFQKGLGYAVVKTVGFSGNCTRVAQGLHKGCTRTAQRPHKDRTVHVFPNFFCFSSERDKIWAHRVISNFQWHRVISNSLWHAVISNFLWHTVYGDWPKTRFDIFLKSHVPGSTEIGQK